MMKERNNNSTMLNHTAPPSLRNNGIITELRDLGREDTMWVIRYMLNHLEELSAPIAEKPKSQEDPLEALDFLGSLINKTGKTSQQLIDECIEEKHGAYEAVR
ncbi:MAG: hypothetical protein IJ892_05840 [Prevotella sp.]|nr:hypothetical protein [Prevotella sp.]